MVVSEIHGECVGFVRVERHIPSVGRAPDSIKVCREGRSCCLTVYRMRNAPGEGGIISKEISRIFQGIIKIIGEDEEQACAQDTAKGTLQP